MADIFHDVSINASKERVFLAVATSEGLASWWTKQTLGEPILGQEYQLGFGAEYEWRAVVSRLIPGTEFELELTKSSEDWVGTHVGFLLDECGGVTQVKFHHTGWPEVGDHFRGSSFCWALYLRLLKRYVERGETVPYEDRDNA